MANGELTARVIRGVDVALITHEGRRAVRAEQDIDELVKLRAALRAKVAGRGRWLLWTWLMLLAGGTVTVTDAGSGIVFFVVALAIVFLIIVATFVARTRDRANNAEEWLSEVDFRLAQLATERGTVEP